MADTNWNRDSLSGYTNITGAATTLTDADSGTVYRVNVADAVFTLPSTEAGLIYHFVIDTVSSGTGCSLSPAAADNINGGTVNKDLINTAGTDVKGDSVTLMADGDEGWLTIGMHGIWAAES
jgi:hypothetical protein